MTIRLANVDACHLRRGMGSNPKSPGYFLPVFFFAAQYAFNFADNFALAAGLILFVLAAKVAEAVAGFEARSFAHFAF